MIEFAKITGDTLDNRIMVTMRTGESLYAPIAVTGLGTPLPSEEWIKNNKDNFLALVAFEKGLLMNPVIMGFYPVKGATSTDYGVLERLLSATITLLEKLINGKVNTSIGPQPFMPDTLTALNEIKKELENINKLVLPIEM